MFAAAGGASLAKRHARRNVKKHPQPQGAAAAAAAAAALHHQQQQLHAHHGHSQLQLLQPNLHPSLGHHPHLYRAPSSRRVSSFCDINGRIVGVSSLELVEIHDASLGGGSSDEDDLYGFGSEYGGFPFGQESAAANALLYVGLGTVAVGMVIAFVGTGEKGFKTLELRLIGPTLIGGGVLCCLLRVLLCVCPSRCLLRRFRHRGAHKKKLPVGVASAPAAAMNTASLVGTTMQVCDPAERLLLVPPLASNQTAPPSPHRSKKRVSLADAPSFPSTSRSGAAPSAPAPAPGPPPAPAPVVRRSSSVAISHGSTGDLPLLAAADAEADAEAETGAHLTDSGSLNGAFTADEATPFPPRRTQPTSSCSRPQPPVPLVHLVPALTPPKAIIVTSPTPSPSPAASPAPPARRDSARELILSPGHLTRL